MKIDSQTKIYGVLGYPVAHSHSPRIFNALFAKYKINAVYHFFPVEDKLQNLRAFLKNIKNINLHGLSITIPFKKKVLPYLTDLAPLAKKLNCVNTISIKHTQTQVKLKGYNFDGLAAWAPILKIPHWQTRQILLLGFGGAAQGILLTLYHHFAFSEKITLAVRNLPKAKKNLQQVPSSWRKMIKLIPLNEFSSINSSTHLKDFDIIINTTPIGMSPKSNFSPLSKKLINKKHFIYDIVYNPLSTKLLKDAKAKGATPIFGLTMFLEQARRQFEVWTGKEVSLKVMQEIYLAK